MYPARNEWGKNRLYEDIFKEAEHIAELSEKFREVQRPEHIGGLAGWIRRNLGNRTREPEIPTNGFCIRCKVELPTNLKQPYCERHWKIWSEFRNKEYQERHCHLCGNEHKTTLLNPLCEACDSKYREDLTFGS